MKNLSEQYNQNNLATCLTTEYHDKMTKNDKKEHN